MACEAINGRVGVYSVLDRHVGVLMSYGMGAKKKIIVSRKITGRQLYAHANGEK